MTLNAILLATVLSLASPKGLNTLSVDTVNVDSVNRVNYSLHFKGNPVIEGGTLGLDLDNRDWEMALALGNRQLAQPRCWMDWLTLDSVSYSHADTTWTPLYGERSSIPDSWNGAILHLSRKDASNYRLDIQFRAYDEGLAFRYFFPEHPAALFHKVTGDLTTFRFPQNTMVWAAEWAQAPYRRLHVDSVARPSERAMTFELPNGLWGAIADADNDDWCLTKLRSAGNNTLESVMYSPVDIVTYYATPWKVIMTADTPGRLLEQNYIIDNLNPPCAVPDADQWVKPGTIMRETTLTTEGARRTIDFCAAHNIPYMLFDWLWYVPCTSHDGDATQVIPRLDMPAVVDYANSKGVGVWLYVNQHALMKQQRDLFPLLRQWGIKGVKSGFVQYASHRWATWLHDMVRLAAENGLMMNIHDEYRPSGFSRTYPNLLTQEGILGNEEFPDATHNVTLPFTRMLNGAADYTICYYDHRLKNSHAHQLAASMVYYSPLVTIFWYDKPEAYNGEPEITWFENLPTTWDESRVLDGHPASHIVMARRKGSDWWIGAMTNNDPRSVDITLDFLTPGTTYTATLYTDDPSVPTRTHVAVNELTVDAGSTLSLPLQGRGGAALRITPASH